MATPRKMQNTGAMLDEKALMLRLAKARTSLILEHPFIGTIALNMPMTLDATINPPTACTNGKRCLFHPEFVNEQTDEELKFLVAHECMHPMLEHNYRRGSRNHRRWNKAGDYVINKLLTDDRIGKMPDGGLLSPEIYNAGGGTTDGIYHVLPEEEDGPGRGPGGGDALDNCEDAEGSPAEQAQQAAEMKVRVAQAAQAAKMMGKLSVGMERLVDEALNPKVDWREVLRRFIVKARTDSRTFARPSRRFASQGFYLPTVSGETLGELLFAVDCSGSIQQDELNQFAAEVRCVKDDMMPTRIHVVYFDSRISHYESYGPDDQLDIKPHGGGGTAFSPIFEYMQEHGIEPVATVVLTDLYCNDYGDVPDCPVLWVSNTDHKDGPYGKPPFGEVVVM